MDNFRKLVAEVLSQASQFATRDHISTTSPKFSAAQLQQASMKMPTGHPADFIFEMWEGIQRQFVAQFLSVEENVEDLVHSNLGEETMTDTIQLLEVLNYLISFPINASTLGSNCGSEAAKMILLVGSSCLDEIEAIDVTKDNHLPRLLYLLRIQCLFMEVIGQLIPSRSRFHDYAGHQPWTFLSINQMLDDTSSDPRDFLQLTIDEYVSWAPLAKVNVSREEQGEGMKMLFLEQFMEMGWFDYFFRLGIVTSNFFSSRLRLLQANSSILVTKIMTCFLILQAEWLNFFLLVLSESPESLPTFMESEFSSTNLVSLLCSLRGDSPMQGKLILRNMILLLRINSFISNMLENTEISYLTLFEMSPKVITTMLVDINRRVRLYGTSLELSSEQQDAIKVVFEYFGQVGQVQIGHDLWPWKHETSFIGSLLVSSTSAHDFHILPQESLLLLKKLINTHPAYLMWDNIFSEILGSTMLSQSKPSQHKSSKVKAVKIKFLFQVFHELFHDVTLLEQCVSLSAFPFLQIKFVDFISELFKAAEASTIFAILTEFDAFRLLLGDYFLLAHKEIFHFAKRFFGCVTRDQPDRDRHKVVLSQIHADTINGPLGWIYLHDTVMDYFHGLVIYSLYFLNDKDSVDSFLSYDDIMLVLLQYVQGQLQSDEPAHDIVFEISRLLINLNDIVVSMVVNGSKVSRDKIIFSLLECLELVFRSGSVEKTIAPTDDPEFNTKNLISRAASSAVIELFMNIMLANAHHSESDWIDAFQLKHEVVMIDFASEMVRLSKGRTPSSSPAPSSPSSTSSPLATAPASSSTEDGKGQLTSPRSTLRKQPSSSLKVTSGSTNTAEDSAEKQHRLRNTTLPIFYLLMDEHHYLAALQVIQTLVLTCAQTIATLDTVSQGLTNDASSLSPSGMTLQEVQQKKQALRTLAGEALLVIFGFMGVAHKHACPMEAAQVSLHAVNSVIVLLREDTCATSRLVVQEVIRREKLLYEMLRSVARSLNGFDALRQKKDPAFHSHQGPLISALLRTYLSLISAISTGNDLCKSEINHLVQGNREKIVASRIKLSTTLTEKKAADGITVPVSTKSASGLASLILCAERLPAIETIVVLFDLLLDGPFAGASYLKDAEENKQNNTNGDNNNNSKFSGSASRQGLFRDDNDRPRLKNVAILNDMMHLIPFCGVNVQMFTISSLLGLISGRASLINLNACSNSRPKLIDSALDLFPYIPDPVQSLNAELIELLGRNNISVASLKHLFRVLQYQDGERPSFVWKIVQVCIRRLNLS